MSSPQEAQWPWRCQEPFSWGLAALYLAESRCPSLHPPLKPMLHVLSPCCLSLSCHGCLWHWVQVDNKDGFQCYDIVCCLVNECVILYYISDHFLKFLNWKSLLYIILTIVYFMSPWCWFNWYPAELIESFSVFLIPFLSSAHRWHCIQCLVAMSNKDQNGLFVILEALRHHSKVSLCLPCTAPQCAKEMTLEWNHAWLDQLNLDCNLISNICNLVIYVCSCSYNYLHLRLTQFYI